MGIRPVLKQNRQCMTEQATQPRRTTLFARYSGRLVRFFRRRVPDGTEAEDLAQDVLQRLLEREELDAVEDIDAFVFTAARNRLRDRARRADVRHRNQADVEARAAQIEVLHPERVLQGRQDLSAVMTALEGLDERQRDMLILHRLDGMKQKDIAELYGLSLSSVEKNLRVAMRHVMKSIEL